MTPEQLAEQAANIGDLFDDQIEELGPKLADELRRLAAENEALRNAYRVMKNSAAGYSNYCEESASTRRCDREFTEAEELFRAAMQKETP